jgi:ribosomal-protein-alanine N-acetyltransferase
MPRPPDRAEPDVTLEPLGPQHAEAMYAVMADAALYRHLDYGPPVSAEYLRGLYTRLAGGAPEGSGEVWINWVILEDGVAVGYVQSTVVPAKREAWIAYVLGTKHQGRGHATRACRALMVHAEATYPVAHWLATVEQDNAASIALLERLRFRRAGEDEAAARELTPTERLFVFSPP